MSFMGGAVLIRRAAYLEVSGYDPVFFMGGEEETLAHKLVRTGWHLRYLPEVVMRHYPSVANAPHLRAHGMRNTLWNGVAAPPRIQRGAVDRVHPCRHPEERRLVAGCRHGGERNPVGGSATPADESPARCDAHCYRRRFADRRSLFNRIDPVRSRASDGHVEKYDQRTSSPR